MKKKIICEHDYSKLNAKEKFYYDYSGFKVIAIIYTCAKCGKNKTKKYW